MGTKQSFVHFYATTHLQGTDRVGSHSLIHIAKPRQARRSSAWTALGDPVGFQRACRFKDQFIDVSHRGDGIVWRFMVMFWIEALGHGEDVVQLVPIKVPVADEFFR
jgi:hypothetical protein